MGPRDSAFIPCVSLRFQERLIRIAKSDLSCINKQDAVGGLISTGTQGRDTLVITVICPFETGDQELKA